MADKRKLGNQPKRQSLMSLSMADKDVEGNVRLKNIAEKVPIGQRWVDKEFPATDSSIWRYPEMKEESSFLRDVEFEWKRPDEIGRPEEPVAVFAAGPDDKGASISPDDIVQGKVGDCYLLAALASVATRPDLIDKLINDDYWEKGVYGVKFFQMGRWITVIVDDLFPCEKKGTMWVPVFAGYKETKEIWMMVVEKAWAKLHKCYQAIGNGMVPDTLVYLTGGYRELFLLSEPEGWDMYRKGILFDVIFHRFQDKSSNTTVFLSSSGVQDEEQLEVGDVGDQDDDPGLMGDHAYSILDVKRFKGKEYQNGELKLIKVRNPWGSYEWSGDYSDESELWTPSLKKACGWEDKDDGAFWMSFDDFCDYFSFIGCCITHSENWDFQTRRNQWVAGKSAGGRDPDLFHYNPTYLLKNTKEHVVIQLEQDDIRDNAPHEMYYRDVFVTVVRKDPNKAHPEIIDTVVGHRDKQKLFPASPFRVHSCQRIKCLRMLLEPGEYYVVASCFHPGFEGSCCLNVFSEGPFQLNEVTPPKPTPEHAKRMAKQKLYRGSSPICCMTGARINLDNGNDFKVKKGVFWDVSKKEKNFRCGECLRPFSSEYPFFDIGMDKPEAWKGYCQNCFKRKFYPKCVLCDTAIYNTEMCNRCNGQFISVPEGRVHEECFVEYQLKHAKSNLVCPVKVRPDLLPEGKVGVVVRVNNDGALLGKLKELVDNQ